MEIYLIRHTEPLIGKGICYGQADLDVTDSFFSEAFTIKQHLPDSITSVYSSPLQRCRKLAEHLFSGHPIQLVDQLKEINCGTWEMQLWNDIAKDEIDPWMSNLINARIPGGESYQDVLERVVESFHKIIGGHAVENNKGAGGEGEKSDQKVLRAVIVTHGGVIRSILSHITGTPLVDSFKVFSLHYGCVIKITVEVGTLRHEVLSNITREKETHKPSSQ